MKFDDAVKQAREGHDELQNVDVPPSLRRRVRQSISTEESTPTVGVRWVLAAAMIIVVSLAAYLWNTKETVVEQPTKEIVQKEEVPLPVQVTPAGWELAKNCEVVGTTDGLTAESTCSVQIREAELTVTLEPTTELAAVSEHAVRLKRGTAKFVATPRDDVRKIWVSDGVIEIVGTEFIVTQRSDGGSVTLTEGKIRFVSSDERVVELTPGESLIWPLPPVEETPEEKPEVVKPKESKPRVIAAKPKPKEVDALLVKVSELRSRRQYSKAISLLRQAIREVETKRVAEKLSFELGSILTYQMKERAPACKHWASHATTYGQTNAIERAQQTLDCP